MIEVPYHAWLSVQLVFVDNTFNICLARRNKKYHSMIIISHFKTAIAPSINVSGQKTTIPN